MDSSLRRGFFRGCLALGALRRATAAQLHTQNQIQTPKSNTNPRPACPATLPSYRQRVAKHNPAGKQPEVRPVGVKSPCAIIQRENRPLFYRVLWRRGTSGNLEPIPEPFGLKVEAASCRLFDAAGSRIYGSWDKLLRGIHRATGSLPGRGGGPAAALPHPADRGGHHAAGCHRIHQSRFGRAGSRPQAGEAELALAKLPCRWRCCGARALSAGAKKSGHIR